MKTEQPAQIDALTGIRGVAAFWVAFHHLQAYVVRPGNPLGFVGLSQLSRDGWLAVDLFFVLSGFIMMHVHGRDFVNATFAKARHFIRLRFARIYPVHFVVLMLHVPLLIVGLRMGASFSAQAFTARSFFLTLFLLNGWGIPGSEGWNVPSWSVSSEWFAYLMFPLIAVAVLRVRRRWIALLAACMILAIAPFFWSALVRVTTGFTVGCLSYHFYKNPIGRTVAEVAAEFAVITVATLSLTSPPHMQIFMLGAFVVAVVGLSQAAGPLGWLMRTRPLVYLGRISYSAYIVHALVLSLYARAVINRIPPGHGVVTELLIVLGFVAVVIVAAHLLYVFVEEPGRVWLRRVLTAKSKRGTQVEATHVPRHAASEIVTLD